MPVLLDKMRFNRRSSGEGKEDHVIMIKGSMCQKYNNYAPNNRALKHMKQKWTEREK